SLKRVKKLIKQGKISAESPTNEYAELGTAAHTLGEKCFQTGCDPFDYFGSKIKNPSGDTFIVDEDMINAVTVYTDYCRRLVKKYKRSKWYAELKTDLSFLFKEIKLVSVGGTGDFVLIHERRGILIVIDYKHGRGVAVEIEGNTQVKMYAVGAKYKFNFKIKKVILAIVQPRCNHIDGPIREEELTGDELTEWERQTLIPAVQVAYGKNPPIRPGEKQCTWCRAKEHCKEYAEYNLKGIGQDFKALIKNKPLTFDDPEFLTHEQAEAILNKGPDIIRWINNIIAYCNKVAPSGIEFKGHKLIESKSNRKYISERKVLRKLKRNSIRDIYEERKLKSPAQLEKHIKATVDFNTAQIKELMDSITIREFTGSKLVSIKDGRDEFNSAETDFKDKIERTRRNDKTKSSKSNNR
ncbi:DUF2800 domain-containing protein, partial [Patescibacteria group bacterium]|nr:DUF2800 domain-containing protein [Patescibacteria group bacterium]